MGVVRVHTVFLLAPGCCAPLVLWVTCIREVFKKNFTPVLYFVHLLRLLLVVDPPTGIFETWPLSTRVNTSLSESSSSFKHRRTMAFCDFSGDQCLLFIRERTPGRHPHYGISEAGLRFTSIFILLSESVIQGSGKFNVTATMKRNTASLSGKGRFLAL